jgi:hypothetical protein
MKTLEETVRTAAPLAVLAALVAGPLCAQTISLSPAVVQFQGALGQSSTQRLTITNGLAMPVIFDLVAQDVVVRDGVRAFVEAGAGAGSVAATAVFSARSVTVPARGSASVEVTVTARPPAAHRAVVALFRGRTRIPNGKTAVVPSLGALLTFTLSKNVRVESGELVAQPPSASTLLAFDATLANTGAEPAVAKGVAAVLDASGRLMGKAPFAARRLLPGERSTFHAEYPGELRPGRYRALATFEYEGRAFTRSADLVVR